MATDNIAATTVGEQEIKQREIDFFHCSQNSNADAEMNDAEEVEFNEAKKRGRNKRNETEVARSSDEESESGSCGIKKKKVIGGYVGEKIKPRGDGVRRQDGDKTTVAVQEVSHVDGDETATQEVTPTQEQRRPRLLFPNDCQLNYQQQVLWAMKLGKEYKTFQPLIKNGKTRSYVTVGGDEAVQMLTTTGYDGVIMRVPEETEKHTKIIIFKYPTWVDTDFLLEDERIVWAKRNVVRGQKVSQAVALIKGEAPSKIFVTGIGYRYVEPFIENPLMCLKCSRWGHASWTCMLDPRCRFCGGNHIATRCGDKIKAGGRVAPRCCNCGGSHNAQSAVCPKRPWSNKYRGAEKNNNGAKEPQASDASSPLPSAQDPPLPQQQQAEIPRGHDDVGAAAVNSVERNAWVRGRPNIPTTAGPSVGERLPHTQPEQQVDMSNVENKRKVDEGKRSEMEIIFDCFREFGKKLENLEKKVSNINETVNALKDTPKTTDKSERDVAEGETNDNTSQPEQGVKEKKNTSKGELAQCKFQVKGKNKVLKPHKLMLDGLGALERVLGKSKDDEKKNSVFQEWLDVHKRMDNIMSVISGLNDAVIGGESNNG